LNAYVLARAFLHYSAHVRQLQLGVRGAASPPPGPALLEEPSGDPRLTDHHRLYAVRAHLLERAGEHEAAREAYVLAAGHTLSAPEKRYLQLRAARLKG
jgi:predicted RNA polymerase sigma factor